MNTNYSFLRSGAFYSVLVMFLIGGFKAISDVIPAGFETIIMGLLGILATYLHVSLAQSLGARN